MKNIYSYCHDYLLDAKPSNVTIPQIDSLVSEADSEHCSGLDGVYRMLAIVLQDYQGLPNSIKFFERETTYRELLCDYDVSKVAKLSRDEIYRKFTDAYTFETKNPKRSNIRKYTYGLHDGAVFLNGFKDYGSFKKFVNNFGRDKYTKEALPLLLEEEIFGLGFASACNWLKELGFKEYPKPDTHMIDAFSSIGLCNKDPISCYKAMVDVAAQCNVEPYKLDKVIWLICSQDFYRLGVKATKSEAAKGKAKFLASLHDWYFDSKDL